MKTRIVQPAASFQPPETCTEHQECRAAQTPLEDLRKNALEHYERVTTIAHEWHSMVPKSINAYFDSLIVDTTGDGAADARAIRLPFPCGCLDAHTGGGITVEEYTCETHRAITTYATAHGEERWRAAIERAAKQGLDAVLAVESSEHANSYSALQKAASVAASIRALLPQREEQGGGVKAGSQDDG